MNIEMPQDRDDAQQIIDALQQIETTPELKAEAATSPQSVLDKLNLSGVARHAVALGLTATLVVPAAVHAKPAGWWG